MMNRAVFRFLLMVLLLALTTGCATNVEPWERGRLAREEMQWVMDPMEEKLSRHIFFSKEASTGGGEAVGGGCGCN